MIGSSVSAKYHQELKLLAGKYACPTHPEQTIQHDFFPYMCILSLKFFY